MGAVAQSKEPRNHGKGKHVERKYHLIWDIIQRGDVSVTKIATTKNLTDLFTKAFPQKIFERDLDSLSLRCSSNELWVKWEFVGIVPSNYYYMVKTLTFYIDINFYILLYMCHEMIVIIFKYHSR